MNEWSVTPSGTFCEHNENKAVLFVLTVLKKCSLTQKRQSHRQTGNCKPPHTTFSCCLLRHYIVWNAWNTVERIVELNIIVRLINVLNGSDSMVPNVTSCSSWKVRRSAILENYSKLVRTWWADTLRTWKSVQSIPGVIWWVFYFPLPRKLCLS